MIDVRRGTTSPNGRVEFDALPAGTYNVSYSKAAHHKVQRVAVVPGKVSEVAFREGAKVTGTVWGPDGRSSEGTRVTLRSEDPGPRGFRERGSWSASDGSYAIDGIEPGDYHIVVEVLSPEHYVTDCGRVALVAGEGKVRDIRMWATSVAGRIMRGDTGQPLSRAEVRVSAHRVRVVNGKIVEHQQFVRAEAFPHEDGRYVFKGIEPGSREVWIAPRISDLNEARRIVEVPDGGEVLGFDFELAAKRAGVLRLKILGEDGEPVTRGLFFTTRTERAGGTRYTTLNPSCVADGAFEFELEAGERRVGAYPTGARLDPPEVKVTIEAGRIVERTSRLIRQGSVLVTILDSEGTPVEKAIFRARATERDGEARPVYGRPLRDGVFELWLDPGRLEIVATSGDASTDPVAVQVKAGEVTSLTIRLR